MLTKILTILILILTLYPLVKVTEVKALEPIAEVGFKIVDKRAKILSDYLTLYASPLQYSAQDFIDAADTYELDWKLVVSISGVESTFGKRIPGGYNAWGWGVYGGQALYFKSWKDGIFTVSEGLKENYVDKGYVTPYAMNRMYAASPSWGGNVTYFMKDLEKFAQNYEPIIDQTKVTTKEAKVAAPSGKLTNEE